MGLHGLCGMNASADVSRLDQGAGGSADGEASREGNGRLLPALPAGAAARPRPEPEQRADHGHVGPHGGALLARPLPRTVLRCLRGSIDIRSLGSSFDSNRYTNLNRNPTTQPYCLTAVIRLACNSPNCCPGALSGMSVLFHRKLAKFSIQIVSTQGLFEALNPS